MVFAFGRIFFIFVAATLCFVLAVFTLRTLGLNTVNTELKHPLMLKTPWVIADGGDSAGGPGQSLPALQAAANYNSSRVLLGLHLRLSNDGRWVLYEPAQLESQTTGQGFISRTTVEEIKKINFKNSSEKILVLEEVFEKIPNSQFYIEILQPANSNLNTIFELIKKHKLEDRVILTSPFADTMREIREKSGAWLTGASTIELSKARFMTSLFLEPTFDLQADVVVIHRRAHPRLIAELSRRKKVLLFTEETVPTPLDAENFYNFLLQHPNTHAAILTTHPNNYRQLVDRPARTH